MPASQAGRRGFESRLPLIFFNNLQTQPNQHLSQLAVWTAPIQHPVYGSAMIHILSRVNPKAVPLLIGNDLRVRARSWCKVEGDRRRSAKLIQPSPSGSRRGWMHRRNTLSGSNGVTTRSEGNIHASALLSGKEPIHVVRRWKIFDSMPTSRGYSVLVELISPGYHERCTLIASFSKQVSVFQPISLRFPQPAEYRISRRFSWRSPAGS